MFRYLGEKIPTSENNSDLYRCEVWFIFCTVYAYFVLFPTGVIAIQDNMFVHLHAYINAKYIVQLHNIMIANDRANVRLIQIGVKCIDWPITEHDAGCSTLTISRNNMR